MSTNQYLSLGLIKENATTFGEYRARVQAVGVALLMAYLVNYIMQGYVSFVKSDEGKQPVLRKLLQTSQIMYWFGIATIFSIVPPFFYGAFHAVMSFLCLVAVLGLHVACFTNKQVKSRPLWGLMHFIYHLLVFIWVLVGLILSYIGSESAYTIDIKA